ncbi:phage terminase small subunit-related protein [Shewanella surugensis]|uniref:Phage terminase small subunit-related protein n=1 Tax=Shewanella surugensis TaxID=212020 RepID=A0ABT0L7W6_9GAMM|nr:phage terminase small subunit-related protein [Shewanella surugensis]MCL1123490.1 phage terminase small subunit-related protein [Shewanella surugensis]
MTQARPPKHPNATTTPEMRAFIQHSTLSVNALAKVLNISEATVRKWRKRDSTDDCSATPHHLNTTLTPLQEYVVVGLRSQLKIPLDKLLKATQTFINPNVSRSGLARCLKRHGVSQLKEVASNELPQDHFSQLPILRDNHLVAYTLNSKTLAETLALPSASAIDVVQIVSMTIPAQLGHIKNTTLASQACLETQIEINSSINTNKSSCVFVSVDVQSDWLYLDIYQGCHTQAANRYIAYVLKQGPFHLRRLLARNYRIFLQQFPDMAKQRHSQLIHSIHHKTDSEISAVTGDS